MYNPAIYCILPATFFSCESVIVFHIIKYCLCKYNPIQLHGVSKLILIVFVVCLKPLPNLTDTSTTDGICTLVPQYHHSRPSINLLDNSINNTLLNKSHMQCIKIPNAYHIQCMAILCTPFALCCILRFDTSRFKPNHSG